MVCSAGLCFSTSNSSLWPCKVFLHQKTMKKREHNSRRTSFFFPSHFAFKFMNSLSAIWRSLSAISRENVCECMCVCVCFSLLNLKGVLSFKLWLQPYYTGWAVVYLSLSPGSSCRRGRAEIMVESKCFSELSTLSEPLNRILATLPNSLYQTSYKYSILMLINFLDDKRQEYTREILRTLTLTCFIMVL